MADFRVDADCGADVGDDGTAGAELTRAGVPTDPPPLHAARSAAATTPRASEIILFMAEPCNEIVKK